MNWDAQWGSLQVPATRADAELKRRLEAHLVSGERLLWVGQPDPSKHFTKADRFLVPFSLLWGGFALFWEGAVLTGDSPILMVLWGIPFLVFGLYFIFGRFIYKALRARRTIYGVTDRRLLVLVAGMRGEQLDAAFLDSIPAINRDVDRGGRGTIVFGNSVGYFRFYANTGMDFLGASWGGNTVSFFDIPEAVQVAELVSDLRNRRSVADAGLH